MVASNNPLLTLARSEGHLPSRSNLEWCWSALAYPTRLRKFFSIDMFMEQPQYTGVCVPTATISSCLPWGWGWAESQGSNGSIQKLSGFPPG